MEAVRIDSDKIVNERYQTEALATERVARLMRDEPNLFVRCWYGGVSAISAHRHAPWVVQYFKGNVVNVGSFAIPE